MDTVPGIKELRARKQDLLLESDLNRRRLQLEWRGLQVRVTRFQHGYGWAQQAFKWGAPLAGFLFARKFQKATGAFAKGSLFLNAAGALWKIWKTARDRSARPSADSESERGS